MKSYLNYNHSYRRSLLSVFQRHGILTVQTVAILGYLEPVVSVLCSAILLHEAMSPAGWVSAVLVIAPAALSEIMPERKY